MNKVDTEISFSLYSLNSALIGTMSSESYLQNPWISETVKKEMVNIVEWSKTVNLLPLKETLAHKVLNAGAPATIYSLTLIPREEGIKKSHPESIN